MGDTAKLGTWNVRNQKIKKEKIIERSHNIRSDHFERHQRTRQWLEIFLEICPQIFLIWKP